MGIEEQQEKIIAIGKAIYQAVPQGWVESECKFVGLGVAGECFFRTRIEGEDFRPGSAPSEAALAFMSLREGMHKDGVGTWFSATFRISNNGDYRVEYDYDNKPEFSDPQPIDLELLNEQRHYPRSDGKMPNWLQEGILRLKDK
ncbi:hypothetical protein NE857_04195 [Nocardiopsis exhalans]|uniref:DUF600 family protein n=1 Tax=Nocardiopsis exhalans TaxID=163604 RepID=A0ABY5DCK3_9ACTN|nr:hypothetical protein [Nocardiopsis exhalans]USY20862.1 hypothetical protein NE857_04195 [Nocardiopsis exhalans]